MRFLVAIPVYNEAAHVRRVLAEVRRYARDVLVVDDGSTDGTGALLASFGWVHRIVHAVNLGYGQSLIDAFRFAAARRFDWIITMDCDEQHEPAFIPAFVDAMRQDDADIISGSRYLRRFEGNGLPPPDRQAINRQITGLLNRWLRLAITDAFCGFKAYRVSGLRRLRLSEPGYAMPLQLWVQAAHVGLRIRELPVRLLYTDPNRHFGGSLDDPAVRRRYYLSVLREEMQRCGLTIPEGEPGVPCSSGEVVC